MTYHLLILHISTHCLQRNNILPLLALTYYYPLTRCLHFPVCLSSSVCVSPGNGRCRTGGTALSTVFGQLGDLPPDCQGEDLLTLRR